jgi:hypothetical protein
MRKLQGWPTVKLVNPRGTSAVKIGNQNSTGQIHVGSSGAEPGLSAIGSSDLSQDFRRRETEKLRSLNSPCHVGKKYDGH